MAVEGAVSFGEAEAGVPSGIMSASVKLKLIWPFAPRGSDMQTALKALPDELHDKKDSACSAVGLCRLPISNTC